MNQEHANDTKRISIALLGKQLTPEATSLLIDKMGAIRYRDAYLLERQQGEAWLFDYGVLVSWNVSEDDRQALCFELESMVEESASRPSIDHYVYREDSQQGFRIHRDQVVMPSDNQLARLALSHAFAQSAKLEFFEDQAQQVIAQNAYISKDLANKGKVRLSRRKLAQLRGVLFETSSDITLHFNLLDTPEFFWDYPELEPEYQQLSKYLDLLPRIEIMNKKLGTIHEMLDMLVAEQYHKHSAFLEWVIIILIAVDILIYFVKP